MLEPAAIEHLVDFVAFSLELSRLDGPTFLQGGGFPEVIDPSFLRHVRSREEIADVTGDRVLGEPRYNADGSFDVMKWARPQNDGPALRALTVMRFYALDGFRERAGAAAMTFLRYDLDYTLSHWQLPCFDLWEENSGFHYHTRLIQYAALARGAAFMATEGDAGRAEDYAAAARELFVELDAHFEPEDGVTAAVSPKRRMRRAPHRRDASTSPSGTRRGPNGTARGIAQRSRSENARDADRARASVRAAISHQPNASRGLRAGAGTLRRRLSIPAGAPITSRLSARPNFAIFSRGPPSSEQRSPSRGKAGPLSPPYWERPPNFSWRVCSPPIFRSTSPRRRFVAATCSFPWCAAIRPHRGNSRSSSTRTTARRIRLEICLGATPVSSPHMRRAGAPLAQWAHDPRPQDAVRRQKFAPHRMATQAVSTTGSSLPRFCRARPRSGFGRAEAVRVFKPRESIDRRRSASRRWDHNRSA